MLSSFTNRRQSDWDKYLPVVLFAYRVSSQSSTGETPFTLLYGREARFPSNLDLIKSNYVIDLRKAWAEAKRMINERAAKEKERYDKPDKTVFKTGDQVRILMPAVAVGLKQKLRNDRWQGPYEVRLVAANGNITVVRENGKPYRVHEDRVKHAEPQRVLSTKEYGNEVEDGSEAVETKCREAESGKSVEVKKSLREMPYRTSRYGRRCFRPNRLGIVQDPIKGY